MMKIALIYPELLGTYGDYGNALALSQRSTRRGIDVDVMNVSITDELPDADLYLLGGGEDGPQRLAVDLLKKSSLKQRVANGAHVFAVCAGLQILGTSFCVEGNDASERDTPNSACTSGSTTDTMNIQLLPITMMTSVFISRQNA